jgi:uncharacterized protein
MSNRLINESSPYLLQHAHNPVDWYPWGEEALQKAKEENKPILVSIGYAACHWCHVMERESFENEETAALMNELFINIKIDREERPDLDHIYMDAVQAMTGAGGWPLNVFLTPDKKPFYGGTYFPPEPMYNRASWKQVLASISQAFTEKRTEIEAQADYLLQHITTTNNFTNLETFSPFEKGGSFAERNGGFLSDEMFNAIIKTADTKEGGFGKAPKFPQTFTIRWLLHHYYLTGKEKALQQACLSLDKMIDGGINDQLGGGFARYSTDELWLAPHFEKMLYDNALLVMALCEAYQLTSNEKYSHAITTTLDFVERELMSPEGGFYAALDADSEGVEGKFYTWSKAEIDSLLGDVALVFNKYYNVLEKGNWEHTNILHVTMSAEEFAKQNNIEPEEFKKIISEAKEKLLLERGKRIRPLTDDKILLGWNAMLNTAYSKAFAATGVEKYRVLAIAHMKFLLNKFESKDGGFYHTYKNGEAKYPAFLDDYAELIHALIHLQEITSDPSYLEKAKSLLKYCEDYFSEEETGYFYFTNVQQRDVIVRKKELYDGAVPSGNSLMAWNLSYGGIVFDKPEWRERALKMCGGVKEMVVKYPGSFGVWAMLIQSLAKGIPEIAVTGGGLDALLKQLLRIFTPFRVLQSAPLEAKGFPLLEGKTYTSIPMIWLCKDYSCQSPVNEAFALQQMIERMLKN